MSCSIANASGSVALRANMGSSCMDRECFLRFLQCRPNLHGSSTTRYVVYCKNLLQLQCTVKLRIGRYPATCVVFRRETLELAVLLDAELHRIADHLVRMAERHSAADEIRCAGQRVHEPARCGLLHARVVESDALYKTRRDLHHARHLLRGGKNRLLRLLHVFV